MQHHTVRDIASHNQLSLREKYIPTTRISKFITHQGLRMAKARQLPKKPLMSACEKVLMTEKTYLLAAGRNCSALNWRKMCYTKFENIRLKWRPYREVN